MKITEQLKTEFIQFYKNKRYKQKTLRRFELTFEKFLDFMGEDLSVEDITIKIIQDYTTHISEQSVPKQSIYYGKKTKISGRTIQEKIQTIKNFMKFCNYVYDIGLPYNRIEIPQYTTQRMDYLEAEEIYKLLKVVDKIEKYEINKIRSKLMILLGYTSGMRLSEMLNLKIYQLEGDHTTIIGKGDKERIVFISDSCRQLMKKYIKTRQEPLPRTGKPNKDNSDYVFISHHPHNFGDPVCKPTVCGRFKKYNKELGLKDKKVSCHVLRHSCATSLLENKVNLYEIKNILGHSSLRTTQTYLHVKNSKLQESMNRTFGDFSY